jgi:hypothetical protein
VTVGPSLAGAGALDVTVRAAGGPTDVEAPAQFVPVEAGSEASDPVVTALLAVSPFPPPPAVSTTNVIAPTPRIRKLASLPYPQRAVYYHRPNAHTGAFAQVTGVLGARLFRRTTDWNPSSAVLTVARRAGA